MPIPGCEGVVEQDTTPGTEGGDATEDTRLQLPTWRIWAGLQQGVEATLSHQLLSFFTFAAGGL